jgi:hypothetical protein
MLNPCPKFKQPRQDWDPRRGCFLNGNTAMDYTATAKQYIDSGYNVLPLQLDGTKKPIGQWKPYQQRLASEHELHEWFNSDCCGIGVIAGAISGNLHILDFDYEAEEHFARFWADVQTQLPGIVDSLLAVQTPRPGRQVYIALV